MMSETVTCQQERPMSLILPRELAPVMRAIPDRIHCAVLRRLFNHLLKGQAVAQALAPLHERCISIVISDTGNELLFAVGNARLEPARIAQDPRPWDVRISGTLADFFRLATRAEDPDTLFFQRRLCIEGDTETGLYLKNILDAAEFDWERHLEAVLGQRAARPLVGLLNNRLGQRLRQRP